MNFLNADEVLAGIKRGAEKFGSAIAKKAVKKMAVRVNASPIQIGDAVSTPDGRGGKVINITSRGTYIVEPTNGGPSSEYEEKQLKGYRNAEDPKDNKFCQCVTHAATAGRDPNRPCDLCGKPKYQKVDNGIAPTEQEPYGVGEGGSDTGQMTRSQMENSTCTECGKWAEPNDAYKNPDNPGFTCRKCMSKENSSSAKCPECKGELDVATDSKTGFCDTCAKMYKTNGMNNSGSKRFKLGDTVRMTKAKQDSSLWRGEDVTFKVIDVYDTGNFDYQIQSQEANKGSSQVKESDIVANSLSNEDSSALGYQSAQKTTTAENGDLEDINKANILKEIEQLRKLALKGDAEFGKKADELEKYVATLKNSADGQCQYCGRDLYGFVCSDCARKGRNNAVMNSKCPACGHESESKWSGKCESCGVANAKDVSGNLDNSQDDISSVKSDIKEAEQKLQMLKKDQADAEKLKSHQEESLKDAQRTGDRDMTAELKEEIKNSDHQCTFTDVATGFKLDRCPTCGDAPIKNSGPAMLPELWEKSDLNARVEILADAGQDINLATHKYSDLSGDVQVALENKFNKEEIGALSNAGNSYKVVKVAGGWEVTKNGSHSGEIFEDKAEADGRAKDLNNSYDNAADRKCSQCGGTKDLLETPGGYICDACNEIDEKENAAGSSPTFVFSDVNGEQEQYVAKDETTAWQQMSQDFGTSISDMKAMGIKMVKKIENGLATPTSKKCPICDGPVVPTEGVAGSNNQYTCTRCAQDFDSTELKNSEAYKGEFACPKCGSGNTAYKDSSHKDKWCGECKYFAPAIDFKEVKNAKLDEPCPTCGLPKKARPIGGDDNSFVCGNRRCKDFKNSQSIICKCGHDDEHHMAGGECETCDCSKFIRGGVENSICSCDAGDGEKNPNEHDGRCAVYRDSFAKKNSDSAEVAEIERHVEGIEHEVSELKENGLSLGNSKYGSKKG